MEIKAKDIEGFLIEKKTYLQSNKAYPHNLVEMRDKAIEEQGEKVLVIELCDICKEGIEFICENCKGEGFTVMAKE